jgi:hypothetical protein
MFQNITKYDKLLSINNKYSKEMNMSTTKNLTLARFVKGILDFLFGLLIVALILLVVWMVAVPLLSDRAGPVGTASVPVRIGRGEEPQFDIAFTRAPEDSINAAFVDEAEGILRLETNSVLLVLIANAAKLVIGLGMVYVVKLLRTIVQAVLDGDPFTQENTKHVRRLGYAVLLVGLIQDGVQFLAANEILNRLTPVTPPLQPGPTFSAELILASLLILLLAHIWSYGLDLERERALTI